MEMKERINSNVKLLWENRGNRRRKEGGGKGGRMAS